MAQFHGLDERIVAAWLARAGQHAQALHAHLVQPGHLDLGQLTYARRGRLRSIVL
jgi:hypothetical protein